MLDILTSILYTAFIMSNKPNIPEQLWPGKNYSFWTDMKVNSWILAVGLTTFAGDMWLYHHKDCPFMSRIVIALIPLPATLLWMRSIIRWIHGMDELHRRVTIEAWLFATTATLTIITVWRRLNQAGTLETIFPPSHFLEKIVLRIFPEKVALTDDYFLTLVSVVSFSILGHFIINRRYK
jgi:hypothetical protein